MSRDATRASKHLSLVLRHDPGAIGIAMDGAGWVSVDELIRLSPHIASREQLDEIVAANAKKRFAYSEDRSRIRASQGHSVSIDLALDQLDPPTTLYHGTATKVLDTILAEGLRPMTRLHVHLSADRETARTVGARHGKPVVLLVDAARMATDGVAFFRSANGVWLVDRVPPEYLSEA